MKMLNVLLLTLVLSACVNNPVPKGYAGPLANLNDSVHVHGSTKADFFVLTHVNGKAIQDSISVTRQANAGQGMAMRPAAIGRAVPAQASVFTIKGRTHHAAPILTLAQDVYEVSGDIEFTPEAGHFYEIKGQLTPEYSAVWIEDSQTRQVVVRKIEVQGSAKLGLFEK